MEIEIDPVTAPAEPTRHPLAFTGNAIEFFQIWIVNTLLTILTFGLYSAWAKVRTQRYLLGNTQLMGANFEYTGDPLQILKGRLLIAAFVGVHFLFARILPEATLVTGLAILVATPWAIVNALAFRLRNTTYRGIRFGFERDYPDAYFVYYVQGVIFSFLTLGLYLPVAIARRSQFLARHARFGQTKMSTTLTATDVYGIALRVVGVTALVAVFLFGFTSIFWTVISEGLAGVDGRRDVITGLIVAAIIGVYAAMAVVLPVMHIQVRRAFWNKSAFGPVRLRSDVYVPALMWIYISNFIAVVFTLGLAYPWTKIRTYRYVIGHAQVVATADDLEHFRQSEAADPRAVGEASVDLLDLGLDF